MKNFKTLADAVNKKMAAQMKADVSTLTAEQLKSVYENVELVDGKLRQVTPEMLEGFYNDPAYDNKNLTDEEFVDAAFKLLRYTYPNVGKVTVVNLTNTTPLFVATSEEQNKALDFLLSANNGDIDGLPIWVGNFFTPNKEVIPDEGMEKEDRVKHIREKVCLTKLFKKDVYSIYEFEIKDSIKMNYSLIGGQFDWNDNKYYKASMLEQYEVYEDEKQSEKIKHLRFIRRHFV